MVPTPVTLMCKVYLKIRQKFYTHIERRQTLQRSSIVARLLHAIWHSLGHKHYLHHRHRAIKNGSFELIWSRSRNEWIKSQVKPASTKDNALHLLRFGYSLRNAWSQSQSMQNPRGNRHGANHPVIRRAFSTRKRSSLTSLIWIKMISKRLVWNFYRIHRILM